MQELRRLPQWLVWRFEPGAEGKKPRKVPYYATGSWRAEDRRQGEQGSPDDRVRLVTYEVARAHAPEPERGGVGFAFLPGDGLIGIDLDAVIDSDGVISERAREIIAACASYTEYSPSRKGVHIIVAGDTAALFGDGKAHSFKSNAIGVEVFCGAQYFTVTGERWPGAPEDVNPIEPAVLRRLYKTVRPDKPGEGAASPAWINRNLHDEARRVEAALAYVEADDYQQWIDFGHAIKHAFGEGGFPIWDRWSSRSSKYDGGEKAAKKWASFSPSGAVKLGSIFEAAKRNGFSVPRTPKKRSSQSSAGEPPSGAGNGDAGAPGDGRPVIRWIQGKLPEIVDQAEDALLKNGVRIYRRGSSIVRVVKRDVPSVRNYRRPAGVLGLVALDRPYLTKAFTAAARWEKWNEKEKGWVAINAPEQVATTYLSNIGHWQVPLLWAAISTPTLRPDGTVLQTPGYDKATRTWYDPCGVEFPVVPESPTESDARAALDKFKEAFESFPYVNSVAFSVALALGATGLVRRSLPAAPIGGITAPTMGTGKTLLADAIALLCTGASAPAMKYADDEAEFAKTMLAVLAEGDQVVLIDNVERPLEGETLCAALTSEAFKQRVLGRTEMMSVPTTTLFLATGNQLTPSGDLRTRTLMCRLDAETEHPEEREFDVDLRSWILEHRAELVVAGLTVMRAFRAAGLNPRDFCKPWGRFEAWSDTVRAPLIWLGCEDPCISARGLEKDDPKHQEHAAVMSAWEALIGSEALTTTEAIAKASGPDQKEQALREALAAVALDHKGDLSPKRLGRWMRKHQDRVIGGKRIVQHGERDNYILWKVQAVRG